jgi:hypothetical protein
MMLFGLEDSQAYSMHHKHYPLQLYTVQRP